jgi:hypothetical protein
MNGNSHETDSPNPLDEDKGIARPGPETNFAPAKPVKPIASKPAKAAPPPQPASLPPELRGRLRLFDILLAQAARRRVKFELILRDPVWWGFAGTIRDLVERFLAAIPAEQPAILLAIRHAQKEREEELRRAHLPGIIDRDIVERDPSYRAQLDIRVAQAQREAYGEAWEALIALLAAAGGMPSIEHLRQIEREDLVTEELRATGRDEPAQPSVSREQDWMIERNTAYRDRETWEDPAVLKEKSSYGEKDRGHFPSQSVLRRLGIEPADWEKFEPTYGNRSKGAKLGAAIREFEALKRDWAGMTEEQEFQMLVFLLKYDISSHHGDGAVNFGSFTPEELQRLREELADPDAIDPAGDR